MLPLLPLLLLLGACAAPGPRINELMADNVATVADNEGRHPDWIELCNPGDEPLSLGGYSLSGTTGDPTLAVLPATWEVPARGYLLLWANGTADEAAFSLPFRLSAQGESLVLYAEEDDGTATVVDSVTFGAQDPDTSVARSPDCAEGWVRSEAPTPGTENP
jgi:hypothetical protein